MTRYRLLPTLLASAVIQCIAGMAHAQTVDWAPVFHKSGIEFG